MHLILTGGNVGVSSYISGPCAAVPYDCGVVGVFCSILGVCVETFVKCLQCNKLLMCPDSIQCNFIII